MKAPTKDGGANDVAGSIRATVKDIECTNIKLIDTDRHFVFFIYSDPSKKSALRNSDDPKMRLFSSDVASLGNSMLYVWSS